MEFQSQKHKMEFFCLASDLCIPNNTAFNRNLHTKFSHRIRNLFVFCCKFSLALNSFHFFFSAFFLVVVHVHESIMIILFTNLRQNKLCMFSVSLSLCCFTIYLLFVEYYLKCIHIYGMTFHFWFECHNLTTCAQLNFRLLFAIIVFCTSYVFVFSLCSFLFCTKKKFFFKISLIFDMDLWLPLAPPFNWMCDSALFVLFCFVSQTPSGDSSFFKRCMSHTLAHTPKTMNNFLY